MIQVQDALRGPCDACGSPVSLEAMQASARLRTLPEASRKHLVVLFGVMPILCATCLLAAYGAVV
jgi:hypothetical protein